MSFLFINKTLRLKTYKLEQLWMQKFQCLLFVLNRSYICYFIVCMTVPLISFYSCVMFCLTTTGSSPQFQQGVYIPYDFKHYITAYKLISEENEIFPIMMKYFSVFYCVKITNKLRQMILWNLDIFNSIQIPHCHLQQENHK